MKLKGLTFTSIIDEAASLDTVTVEMTVKEALWIARIAGEQRGNSPHHEIYSCLVGDVFNRFWDDGVADAARDYPFEIPPIRYDDKPPEENGK